MPATDASLSAANGDANVNGVAPKQNLPAHFRGGNGLDVALPSGVKDFVAKNDGHSVITSVRAAPLPPPGRN